MHSPEFCAIAGKFTLICKMGIIFHGAFGAEMDVDQEIKYTDNISLFCIQLVELMQFIKYIWMNKL